MKTVGTRELKNRLSQYIRLVRKGETITVTARGKPVVNISPHTTKGDKSNRTENLLRRLEREGHLWRAKGNARAFQPVVTKGKSASRMVREDRD